MHQRSMRESCVVTLPALPTAVQYGGQSQAFELLQVRRNASHRELLHWAI